MASPVYLALGTNLGNRLENLHIARQSLPPDVLIRKTSSIYITPPWGYEEQPDFLNQVLEVETELMPSPLLSYLKEIEAEMGRLETFRYGPRLIDIDILFYASQVIQEEDLQIPHPRLQERAFVLVPMHEIAPDFFHPVLNETIAALLTKITTDGVRRL